MAARALLGAAAQQHHAGTGGQQQDRGHGERHRRGTRLAQAARLGGIHLAVRARLDRRLLRLGKRVSHLGGSRVLVGGDLLRSVEGGLELVRAGLVIRLGELAGAAITSFRAVLSADLTVTSKDFAKSVPLSATVTVTLPAAANGFARSTGLPARRVFMAWLVHEILMFSRYYRRCEMKVGSVL